MVARRVNGSRRDIFLYRSITARGGSRSRVDTDRLHSRLQAGHYCWGAGGQCAGKACWKASRNKAFKYKDKELTPDGPDTILLKSGDEGKAKIIVNGKGANLDLP